MQGLFVALLQAEGEGATVDDLRYAAEMAVAEITA